MDNIYIADLIFVAKRVIKSLPEFHGARFSAFLRYACKVNKIKMEDCISAILPFRKGISHISIGDKLRLRLILTDFGVEKLPSYVMPCSPQMIKAYFLQRHCN